MATTGSLKRRDQGLDRSDKKTFTIGSGASGSAVTPIDLGRAYAFIVVSCDDASHIPSTTTMTAQAASDDTGTVKPVYQQNGVAVWTSGTLPTSGGFRFVLPHAAFAQQLRFVLSNNASGGSVAIDVYGFDGVLFGNT